MGTYQVTQHATEKQAAAEEEEEEEDTSPPYTRRGRITLHQLADEDDALQCHTLDTLDCAAVLDMSWLSYSSTLIAALADGHLSCHTLSSASLKNPRLSNTPPRRLCINDRAALCLSVDVASDGRGLVSQSDGTIAFLPNVLQDNDISIAERLARPSATPITTDDAEAQNDDDSDDDVETTADEDALQAHASLNTLSGSGVPAGLETWQAHAYEAWCVGFSAWSPFTLWSGGDDLTLKGWDLRQSNSGAGRKATFATTRPFQGGVTSLQASRFMQHTWAVGSYDAHLRLFDERMTAKPTQTLHVGGGVWRVQWHPVRKDTLLLATMHDGFKVLRLQHDAQAQVVTSFQEHESLAYGCDWDREENSKGLSRIQSCSFYDCSLHVWRA